ncbi:MAG: glycoside hydrolase family 32 protein [Chloroflexi bacterium]|nr:glycoside hydrolase family 32 protein [Chloroflexota bacterium]
MTDTFYQEKYRPQFHFTARQNWINDPNGLVFYKGAYHLFFQHNPSGIEWGNMTWGHAVSSDLIHWQQLENVLLPDSMGTMFSGSAVVDWDNTAGFQQGDEKTIVLIYTAAGNQSPESRGQPFTQCLAYSTDGGRSFTKYALNPVLKHIIHENRDPKVTWHAPSRRWIMALYLDKDVYGLFTSPDLKAWTHLQDVVMPGCSECPDIFEIPVEGSSGETRWVFIASNGHYLAGSFDGAHFAPDFNTPRIVDFGANYYAVQTYSDMPNGRRIQVAWMSGGKYPGMPFNQQMSFPCVLRLARSTNGLQLLRTPVKEAELLHAGMHEWAAIRLERWNDIHELLTADLLDIDLVVEVDDDGEFMLRLHGEPLTYSAATGQLTVLGRTAVIQPHDGRIELRVLVDRASIEVFVNGGEASLTSCFLPDSAGPNVAIQGVNAQVIALRAYEMHSAWNSARQSGS